MSGFPAYLIAWGWPGIFGQDSSLPLGATIQLSASSIAEDASVADVIGILSVANGSGTYTFTITADPDSKFQIDNDDELQVGDTLDYETDTSHSVTIEADNGVDDPITRQFTITITDVLAPGQITITPVEEPTEDTTPSLTIGFPHGNGNATDAAEGDELIILASDDDFATDETYIEHTLTSDDIDDIEAETPITLSGATPLAVGTWKFRGHLERSPEIGVDSLDATQTIEAPAGTTLNPADKHADITLSGGDLVATHAVVGAAYRGVRSVASTSSAKWYWEITVNAAAVPGQVTFGFANSSAALDSYFGVNTNSVGWTGGGNIYLNNGEIGPVDAYGAGSVLGLAVDFTAELLWFRVDGGDWNNSATANPATATEGIDFSGAAAGPFFAGVSLYSDNDQATANFGATAFEDAAPSGFSGPA